MNQRVVRAQCIVGVKSILINDRIYANMAVLVFVLDCNGRYAAEASIQLPRTSPT